ncbi:MAG TPA: HAMP domain-containing sensor histidine kinase [Cyclobacteriaceae bacterium]|nr:HAMP domain-containing histidine kinase [Flammeovirgaceae bacterium]HOO09348.1 HAMP domain-containing sensor histidine kinase [Cyclobacteriaceae bacterium]
MKIWSTISDIGTPFGANPAERRYIQICNRVSFIIFVLVFLLFLVAFAYFRWIISTQLALAAAFSFLVPPWLNHLGKISWSRLLLIVLITLPSLAISILDKLDHPGSLEEFEYYHFRIIILCASILPFILFSLKERYPLSFGLLLSFLSLVLYDPIHHFFHAGFYQMGFTSPNYYFMNYIFVYNFLVLAGSTFFLKYSFEKSEKENESLIHQLSERQKEILVSSKVIEEQREQLTLENRHLNKELVDKNNQLIETNKELIRHNNELQQFSYTVSHNLRGPVASLTGLLGLLDTASLNATNKEILGHLNNSVGTLDSTIRDLGNIIDIRNDITRIKQKILLREEVDGIIRLLKRDIDEKRIQLHTDFNEHPFIYSVRPMLQSILYNLVSNGIKYRSVERDPIITISSHPDGDKIKIIVEDNGMGIDMKAFGAKLFGLYKRFHTHTEGRGLGLFLVKLQVESLDGDIEVESTLHKGTKFTLSFPRLDHIEEQVLADDDIATVYYNAPLNCIGINWKRAGSFKQTRTVIEKCIDFIKDYKTANWISNITRVTEREEGKLNELRASHRMELKMAGLLRVGLVVPEGCLGKEFMEQKGFAHVFDVELKTFATIQEAKDWMEKENSRGA